MTAKPKKVLGGFMKKLTSAADDQKAFLKFKLGEERVIMTGDPTFDWAMGGYKRGEANLFYGPSKSGKSTMALKLAAEEQKRTGGLVIIFDSEYAHDTSKDPEGVHQRWLTIGLDPDKTVSISSNLSNELFAGLADLEADLKVSRQWVIDGADEKKKPSNYMEVAAIVVDSWGGIESETAKEKIEAGNISGAAISYGGNAKTINPIIQTILRISSTYGIMSLHVQHCIENMDKDPRTGAYRGPKWILLGGQKLRYLSQSITFMETVESGDSFINEQGLLVKEHGGNPVGKKIRVRCEKSRKQVEGRKAETWINFTNCTFARTSLTLFTLASGLKVIGHPMAQEKDKKGKLLFNDDGTPKMKQMPDSWWAFMNEPDRRVNGSTAMVALLESDPELAKRVLAACMNTTKVDAVDAKMGAEEGVGSTGADEAEDNAEEVANG